MNGKCESNGGCGPGQAKCDGSCKNTANDNSHCGGCDKKVSQRLGAALVGTRRLQVEDLGLPHCSCPKPDILVHKLTAVFCRQELLGRQVCLTVDEPTALRAGMHEHHSTSSNKCNVVQYYVNEAHPHTPHTGGPLITCTDSSPGPTQLDRYRVRSLT